MPVFNPAQYTSSFRLKTLLTVNLVVSRGRHAPEVLFAPVCWFSEVGTGSRDGWSAFWNTQPLVFEGLNLDPSRVVAVVLNLPGYPPEPLLTVHFAGSLGVQEPDSICLAPGKVYMAWKHDAIPRWMAADESTRRPMTYHLDNARGEG